LQSARISAPFQPLPRLAHRKPNSQVPITGRFNHLFSNIQISALRECIQASDLGERKVRVEAVSAKGRVVGDDDDGLVREVAVAAEDAEGAGSDVAFALSPS
jgi:hypothetical protein